MVKRFGVRLVFLLMICGCGESTLEDKSETSSELETPKDDPFKLVRYPDCPEGVEECSRIIVFIRIDYMLRDEVTGELEAVDGWFDVEADIDLEPGGDPAPRNSGTHPLPNAGFRLGGSDSFGLSFRFTPYLAPGPAAECTFWVHPDDTFSGEVEESSPGVLTCQNSEEVSLRFEYVKCSEWGEIVQSVSEHSSCPAVEPLPEPPRPEKPEWVYQFHTIFVCDEDWVDHRDPRYPDPEPEGVRILPEWYADIYHMCSVDRHLQDELDPRCRDPEAGFWDNEACLHSHFDLGEGRHAQIMRESVFETWATWNGPVE